MADTGGVGGAGGAGGAGNAGNTSDTSKTSETDGPEGAGEVGASDSVSESEADSIGDDATSVGDDVASAVGESVVGGADAVDSLDAADEAADDEAEVAADEAADEAAEEAAIETAKVEAAPAAPVEEPGFLESAATWAGQTAKGYATGAINGVLDAANLVNTGVNAGLSAVGVDYQFKTDMNIAATSPAEQAAQNAITVASVVTGVAGAVKAGPALAGVVDDVAAITKGVISGTTVASVAKLGDLRPTEIAQIQAAVEELGQDLYVVGSAAKGMRRNIDSDLPLAQFGGSKANTRSDIDYAVANGYDDAASALNLPDMDPGWGVRGVDYLTLDNSPAIRFSPGKDPEFLSGTGRINLD